MPHAGEGHGHIGSIGGIDNQLILDGTAGLNNSSNSCFGCGFNTITEGKEGIGGHYGAGDFKVLIGCLDTGNPGAVDAAHLAGSYANGLLVFDIDDGIGFYIFDNFPGE